MRRLLRILLVLILVSLAAVGATFMAGERAFRQQSPAVRLVYDVRGEGGDATPAARAAVMAVQLKRRLDRQEMRDVQVTKDGAKVVVLAPASVPILDLKRVLRIGGMLSFHVIAEDSNEPGVPEMLARLQEGGAGPAPQPGDQLRWVPAAAQDGISPLESSSGGASYILVHATPQHSMTHDDPNRAWKVERARPMPDKATGGMAVAFELDRNGAQLFGELTGAHIGKMLAIVLDGHVLSAPRINTRIEGHGLINGPPGGFTQQQASYLATTLNAGALPGKLADEPVSEEYVTMTVGLTPFTRETLRSAAIALAVAAALVCCGLLLLRRLHPTVRDPAAALKSLGMFNET